MKVVNVDPVYVGLVYVKVRVTLNIQCLPLVILNC